jgi:hypothetical protein
VAARLVKQLGWPLTLLVEQLAGISGQRQLSFQRRRGPLVGLR